MVKILITTYYDLKEALLLAANELTSLGHTVDSYPLFKKYNDPYDKLDNYVDDFIDTVKKLDIDVILWWYMSVPCTDIERIVESVNTKHIMFNWDEPYNWKDCDMQNKAKFFDCVFVSCEETLSRYIDNGSKDAKFLLPGYSDSVHSPIVDTNDEDEEYYGCDISICVTNLYENDNLYPDQYINRKRLVDIVYENQGSYKFNIYGPEKLRDIYPKSYKKFVSYEETNKVFNYSKINICTHVISDKYRYLNERAVVIAGSGGLLFIDKIKGVETIFDDKSYVSFDKDNVVKNIQDVLSNYDDYYTMRYRLYQDSKKYTWGKWAEQIDTWIKSTLV